MALRVLAAGLAAVGLLGGICPGAFAQTLGRPAIDVGPTLPPAPPSALPAAPVVSTPPTIAVAPPTLPALPPAPPLPRQPIKATPPAPVLQPTPTYTAPVKASNFADAPPTLVIPPPVAKDPPPAPPMTPPKLGPMPTGPTPAVPPGSPPPASPMPIPADTGTPALPPGTDAGTPSQGHDFKGMVDSLHHDDNYGLKSLWDSLHPEGEKGKHWYEKLSLRGYTQFRFGRTVDQDLNHTDPAMFGDRSINGNTENFSIRRMRLILFGDVSEHLGIYIQPDFTNTPAGGQNSFFGQLRDAYGDVYLDKEKVNRLRVGLSKVPYGWENMQSSQNRIALDRTNPLNSSVPNERDLGVFYYWTPEDKQKLFKDLVDGGLKGSGNYGIFGIGVYNGQASHILEQNMNLHTVARVTYPFQLPNGQVVEASVQGYTGEFVVQGAEIRALGQGDVITPEGTGGRRGVRDSRAAATVIWYPQPFGFQAEWNVGKGPGLNDAQTEVLSRSLQGGYLMAMYKHDTCDYGIFTPYARYSQYKGGYKSVANAPYGSHEEWNLGVEWQIRKEMELTVEYSFVNGLNFSANDDEGARSYRNFDGGVLRFQFQVNY